MARDFITASSQRLDFVSGAITSGVPFSMGGWFMLDSITPGSDLGVMGVGNLALNNDYFLLQFVDADDNLYATIRTNAGGLSHAISSSSVTATTWHHGLAVYASTTSRQVYLDGVAGTENTDTKDPGLDTFVIGAGRRQSGFISHFNGQIAEAGMWSVALSSADAAQLAAGVSPLMVRPDALLAYWPLHGRTSPEIDVKGGNNLTLTNTPATANHSPIIKRSTQGLQFPPVAVAPGGRIMSSLARYGGLAGYGGIAGLGGGLAR